MKTVLDIIQPVDDEETLFECTVCHVVGSSKDKILHFCFCPCVQNPKVFQFSYPKAVNNERQY